MKTQLKAFEHQYNKLNDSLKAVYKYQQKIEKALASYSKAVDEFSVLLKNTELMYDVHLNTSLHKPGDSLPANLPPLNDPVGGSSGQDELLNATKGMQETQMSFNLQYLQLQSQMQHENRSYTAVSNIMKTKHDTVKNSISNVR